MATAFRRLAPTSTSAVHGLQAQDEASQALLTSREHLLHWLDSWLQDPSSWNLTLSKLSSFSARAYVDSD